MDQTFDVSGFLCDRRGGILERAAAGVASRHLPHYEAAGESEVATRLATLFDVVVTAADDHRLDLALAHADAIAVDRHESGHDLAEIQTAINALEEQIWRAVLTDAPVESQGVTLGVVSTILGALKDRLACTYVSRVAPKPLRSLHVEELFLGTEAGQL